MSTKQSLKTRHERVVRTTISLAPQIQHAAQVVMIRFGFSGLSEYITMRVRQDAGLNDFMRKAENLEPHGS
jgi:hypothetical protein